MSLRTAGRVVAGVVVVAGVAAAADPGLPPLPIPPILPAAVVPPPADKPAVPAVAPPAVDPVLPESPKPVVPAPLPVVDPVIPAPLPFPAPAAGTKPEPKPEPKPVADPKPTPEVKPVVEAKPASPAAPSVGKVVAVSASSSIESLPMMLAEAKTAYAKLRDYVCHYIRQERVSGRLVPEETCELRVRTQPFSVSLKVVSPKEYANRDTVLLSARSWTKVRFKEATKLAYQTLPADDPRVVADTRHLLSDIGLLAVLERVENAVLLEKRQNNPVQVAVSEYTFAGRPCVRYEVFCDRPHAHRYAHRHVLFVDKVTKLPVRYEAYDQPLPGAPSGGELIEAQSFIGIKTNVGLGESAFER